ncbi:MAG: glycerophosphodiester phosphodiesterase [Candidatus Aminicenantes bacterium]|nr:glycerophosphodiester phosphodiesterase [Candidatus Aminicenantes bacterium]
MKLRKFLSHEHPLRFAHRGSTILWPENTLTAFQGVVDHGGIYIETDLHATKDGVIVLFHDDSLERTTDGRGLIEDWYWNDLRRLDAAFYFKPEEGYPFRNRGVSIPCLEEVLKTFPRVMLNLDLKQAGIESLVADFITRHGYEERVLIASFKDRRVRKCRSLLKNRTASSAGTWEAALSWAYSRIGKSYPLTADVLQVPVRRGGIAIVDKKFLKAAHSQGLQVHTWTIDEPGQMRRLIELGVDGIITNRIDLLNRAVAVAALNLQAKAFNRFK